MLDYTNDAVALGAGIAVVTDVDSITIPEGEEKKIQVKLSTKIRKDMTVRVFISQGNGSFQTNPSSLTFTPKNWKKSQEVFIKSLADNNADHEQGVVTLSGDGIAAASVAVFQQDAGGSQPSPPSSARVVIDPVTRIEGHLKIETQVDNGVVTGAWSTATLFRGIETILQNRDPRDAPIITQRLCGVCTYIHMLTSSRCLEDAFGVNIPQNAQIMRNLLLGAQYVHDHIVHFYHLHGMDWVDIVSALDADPDATAALAGKMDAKYFTAVRDRLQAFVDSRQLGPFKNAYWGHSAYKFSPEQNLLLATHYLEALKKQAEIAKLHAIFGGKNPHPHSVIPGGVTCAGELGVAGRIEEFRTILKNAKAFVDQIYLPDVLTLASVYPEWASIGGFENLMSFGEFATDPNQPENLFLPQGIIMKGDWENVQPVDLDKIGEHVAHSWYRGNQELHPYDGETVPEFTGQNLEDRYSWLKAPRYSGFPMEVGPLARVMVAYGSGHSETVLAVDDLLFNLSSLHGVELNIKNMFSTLGRTAARAIETQVICDAMFGWLNELEENINGGDDQVFESYQRPSTGQGRGINEAPRGALGHWIKIQNGNIDNYQMVIPSTWNFGPRDLGNVPGPVEQALLGVPTAEPSQPLEMLRVIHSFDPCIACGVHVIDSEEDKVYEVKVL